MARPPLFERLRSWFSPPRLPTEDASRRARLLSRLLVVMLALSVLGCTAALLEPRNDVAVTLGFYGSVWVWLFGVVGFVRRGRIALAAWVLSGAFWAIIALATLLFGGMQGQNATAFGVCVLLLGSVVGGRAAIWMAIASAAWCGFVAWLEVTGRLPPPIEPYSPVNAWSALTVTVLLTSVLLRTSLESLQDMHARTDAAARERDEALQRSIQGQKMELVGNLTSGIAHDFNNLLTVIRSVSDVLRQELPRGPGNLTSLLDDLDDATSRATLMTRQVLSFGRAAVSEPEVLDLSAVVSDLQRMLPRLLGPQIEIVVEATAGAYILASRAALEQILLNLAVNSKEAMPHGGTLRFVVTSDRAQVRLATQDTGIGIDEATQRRLFEPFFTTKATGTGLGLTTVRELTERMSGTIAVTSAPGKGTTFELCLPRADVTKLELSGHVEPPPSAVPKVKLLLVEDDSLVRRSLARWLVAGGFEVVEAVDGGQALEILAESSGIACVISDISMPNVDGEQLAAALDERYPGLPLVLVSGDRAPLPRLLAQPRRAFVPKPLSQKAVADALSDVLNEHA